MTEYKGTVVYVGGFELPDRNPAAHRVLQNAKILKEIGYNVVFSGVDKKIETTHKNADDVYGFKSFPIAYPNSTKKMIKHMIDISHYEDVISNYNDVKYIFCYNLHAVPLAKLLKFAKSKSIKIIADCTEWYENKFSVNPIKLIKCVDTFLCMHVFQKKCDSMIAISSFLGDYYRKYIKNTIVLPPLVDLKDEKYKTSTKQNDVKTLVYSGNPIATKEALGNVVKSLVKFNDLEFKLLVVGITKEQFIKIYGFEPECEKIKFLGRVSHVEALNIVKQSDYSLIIRPKSRLTKAGFPTKFAEAISCGTAVIANDNSDIAKYLENGKNGHLVSLENLEEDLYKILSSGEIPQTEKDIFDYHKYIEAFEKLLENL